MHAYRMYRRHEGVFYLQHARTLKRISLKTKDREEAEILYAAYNESERAPALNRKLGMAYLSAADPKLTKRTWGEVMEAYRDRCHGPTLQRVTRALKDPAFEPIRSQSIIETTAEEFLLVLKNGHTSTNIFLRRFHNLAVDMDWLPKRVLPKKLWPSLNHQHARSITLHEHQRIIEREPNRERRLYYELLWETGMSQTDASCLHAEQINWKNLLLITRRQKLKSQDKGDTSIKIGGRLATILRELPAQGPLFPYLKTVREIDRGTEFKQRCAGLNITGITLRSYKWCCSDTKKRGIHF